VNSVWSEVAEADIRYLVRERKQGFEMRVNGHLILSELTLEQCRQALAKSLQSNYCQAFDGVALAASVVEYKGRILVLARMKNGGHWVLTKHLVDQGCRLIAERHLLIDKSGAIHPCFSTDSRLGPGHSEALNLPVALIGFIRFRPGSRWRPKVLPTGTGLQRLLKTRYIKKEKRALAFHRLAILSRGAEFLESERDCPKVAATSLLRRLSSS